MKDLYHVQVPISSQQASALPQQLAHALDKALVKITGSEEALQAPEVRHAKAQIHSYVTKFAYRQTATKRAKLAVNFSPHMLDKLLTQLGFNHVDRNRPLTLVWLAINTPHQRAVLGEGSEHPFVEMLTTKARDHGIPLVLPLRDLDELNSIRLLDVEQKNTPVLSLGARRYGAEQVLVGNISSFAGEWICRWSLLGEREAWQTRGPHIEPQFTALLQQLAQRLLAPHRRHNPIAPQASQPLQLHVKGIGSIESYTRILTALHQLRSVEHAEIEQISNDNAWFKLKTSLDATGISHALQQHPFLTPNPSVAANPSILHYQVKQ